MPVFTVTWNENLMEYIISMFYWVYAGELIDSLQAVSDN